MPILLLFYILLFSTCSRQHDVEELILDLQSKNPSQAHNALIELTQHPNPKALEAVIAYSAKKAPEERIQSILAARQFKDKRAMPWLFVLSTGHPDELVKNAAREALTYLEKQGNEPSTTLH